MNSKQEALLEREEEKEQDGGRAELLVGLKLRK
jgi:hypothetical protein